MNSAFETETKVNSRWQLDPSYKGKRIHEELLRHEFLPRHELLAQHEFTLRCQLEHCFDTVPYYQAMFRDLGISRRHLRDSAILQRLPVLTKAQVAANGETLQSLHLPPGNGYQGQTQTSGTTGEPLKIRHSQRSLGLYRWLKQREYRWFRFDPLGVMLQIRPNIDLPRPSQDTLLGLDQVVQLPYWPLMENLFKTGKMWGFSNINKVESQRELLTKVRPNYLLMQASCLEYLSLQKPDAAVHAALRGALSISQTLTPKMRALIEESLRVPVQQNYGLNEVGIVASYCMEGSRYHVHAENCFVEIVDVNGAPVAPGSSGKLLVTALSNAAMPLLRYDADDLATAVDADCPCGKSLPSFGSVQGRYRRTAYLPAGTFQRWAAIQLTLYRLAREQQSAVRKYQAYQDTAGDFTLRIDCSETTLANLENSLRTAFIQAYSTNESEPKLSIVRTEEFIAGTGNKFQNFISEFSPEMDQ